LAFSVPVTLYLFLEADTHRIPKPLFLVMLLAQFYGIIVAMSRAPWYALLIALFVMQFTYPKFRKLFIIIAFLAAIVLAATWNQVTDSDVALRVGDKNSTLEGRQGRWAAGANMWRARPIRGWGFGRYEQESGRFRTDGSKMNLSAVENDYLHILVSAGLIGFLPYAITLLAPLINSLRLLWKMRSPSDSSRRDSSRRDSSRCWTGFIGKETIAVYGAVLICFAITSYTAAADSAGLRLIVFTVAGTVVGTHEHLLRGTRRSGTTHAGAIQARSSIPLDTHPGGYQH
jgi:O-antigen ligase